MLTVKDKKIKRVGVLRGGPLPRSSGLCPREGGTEIGYYSSIKKGGEIILYISENLGDKYKVIDILIDKDYIWHLNGVPVNPSDLINKVDLVWNTSHPSFSNILDSLLIPNIGVSSFFYALDNNKEMLRDHIRQIGIQMPRSVVLPVYQKDFDGPREKYSIKKAKEVFEKFSSPWIIKSFTEDLNMGIHLAKTFPELVDAIEDGVKHEKSILVEEFIAGKVASVHSVRGFRMGDLPAQAGDIYTFPLGNSFGVFSTTEKEKLSNLVKDLHKHINSKHYLKSDFVMNPRGRIYLLQASGMPDLKQDSHLSQVCESVGARMHHVVEHILENVL